MAFADLGGKIIVDAFAKFKVTLGSDSVVPGDLLYPDASGDSWLLADESDSYFAQAVAIDSGNSADVITAALAVIAEAPPTIGTRGIPTAQYFAAAGDVCSPLYLSTTDGKASGSAGGTLVQPVGYIISRTQILLAPGQYLSGVSQTLSGALTVAGAVIHSSTLAQDGVQTMATNVKLQFRDTGVFIHSSADGKLTISADGAGLDDIILTGMVQPSRAVLPANVQKATLTDIKTLADTDCGVVQVVTVDAKTITLPATVVGYAYTIMNGGADGACIVTVAPNASDKVYGNGFTATDNKAIINTKATAKMGDYIKLIGDGVNGWMITEINGIWARA